ncbi:MAG: integrase [Actinomycetia bacterium]|nr:integrase [Actinomycetes bacterium]
MVQRVWRFDRGVRRQIVGLAAQGRSQREIAATVTCSQMTVCRVLRPLGGVRRSDVVWEPSPQRLSLEERIEIRLGLERGESLAALGRRLGRATSTISRDVAANGGRDGYRPLAAHRRAAEQARRPKVTKLATHPDLCTRVIADLEAWWSPQQIARRLRHEFGDDTTMNVSHETIYKSLYVQGRGELRRELARCLRTGRAQRRAQGRIETRGRITDMVMISERPAEVADRAVPGHWEGDLIIGKNGKSAIGTLVERATRYVMLLHLPNGRDAEAVRDAMTATIQTLPATLRRTLTWDQGVEMAQHRQFSIDTGVDVYFCDPHTPWQRGSNENTNGLLRQYFPKGTDLSVHDAAALQAAADSLNGRPRETLNGKKPTEQLAEFIAMTG